jgi:hypothetical protein
MTLLEAASAFASASPLDVESAQGSVSDGAPLGGHAGVLWVGLSSPRIKCAWFGTRWLNASIDFSDLYSCMNPTDTTIVTATAILIASSLLPTNTEAPAEQSKRRIRGSLNCFKNRSHTGSGSSCGSSFGPWSCNRERAWAGVRPVVREVCSRSAVSLGVRLENSSAIDYGDISSAMDIMRH